MDQENKIETKQENTTTANNSAEQSQPEDSKEQINWRKFREQREVERKQKEASDKRAEEESAKAQAFKAALEAITNKQTPQASSSFNSDEEETEDQKIDKKVNAALLARERKYDEERKQREHQEFPDRLKNTYNDFDRVCTTENLDYLEYHYPEVASAFKQLPDGFDKWSSVYKAVKRFVPNTESKKEQSKAEKNFNKPQSMASPGVTQTGDTAPIQLDDKRRADNWARMQKVIKGGR